MMTSGACALGLTGLPATLTVHVARAAPLDPAAAGLDADERARAAAFRRDGDRDAFVTAHALLRQCLSARLGGAPAQWRFGRTALGKPTLDPAGGASFNISHTRGWAACVLDDGRSVGIDIEAPEGAPDVGALAPVVLTRQEQADVAAAGDAAAQTRRFLTYWTVKEAFLKAAGRGLSVDPATVHVAPGPGGSWRLLASGFGADPAGWRLAARHVAGAVPLAVAWSVTERDQSPLGV